MNAEFALVVLDVLIRNAQLLNGGQCEKALDILLIVTICDESLLHGSFINVLSLQNGVVNAVSASLLCSPNFRDPRNQARMQLVTICEKVMVVDPEFVLKVLVWSELAFVNHVYLCDHFNKYLHKTEGAGHSVT